MLVIERCGLAKLDAEPEEIARAHTSMCDTTAQRKNVALT